MCKGGLSAEQTGGLAIPPSFAYGKIHLPLHKGGSSDPVGKIYAINIETENGTVIVGEAHKMGRIDLLYQIIML